MYDAHLSHIQFKTIRKYTMFTFQRKNPFQPMPAVRKPDVAVFEATNVPFKDNNRKRVAHYRPIDDDVFSWKISQSLSADCGGDRGGIAKDETELNDVMVEPVDRHSSEYRKRIKV
jgi:hypothetical protein